MSPNLPLCLQFSTALGAELGTRLVLLAALRTNASTANGRTALATEFGILLKHGAAFGTFQQTQRLSAIVAELALSSRLTAMRTNGSAFLQLAVPYCGGLSLFVDVATHGLVAGFGHIAALAGSAGDAKAFFLVPAVGAYPLVARRTFYKLRFHLGLSLVERLLLLLAPLGTVVLHAVADNVGARFDGVAETSKHTAEQVAEHAGTTAQAFGALTAVVGARFSESGFETVTTAVTVKFVLETRFGGKVVVIFGKSV